MNTKENIETRRSIKHYDPDHVMAEEDLAELIRLTKLAPSSFNMQNYRLLVVRDKELREQIRAAAWDQEHVTTASVLFLMCADLDAHNGDPSDYWGHAPEDIQDVLGPMIKPFYEGKDELIRDEANRSTAFAGMTLMLAAREMGYDSCPMIGFDKEAVSKLVNLPQNMMLGYMIAVGEQSKSAWVRGPRLSDEKVVAYDRF